MNRIWTFIRGLDWRVLFLLPALAVLLGIANNLRVSPDLRVRWSGERPENASVAETDVERGVWTSNFAAATNAAEAAHLPVVVAVALPECPLCVRFHNAIDNEEVKAWQKKLGWYFVMSSSTGDKETLDFVRSTPIPNNKSPYVGVYWLRSDGWRMMRNFSAQSGQMGVPAESSLAQEWMHAIEASVPGAPGASFVSEQGPGVQVCVKVESQKLGWGRVRMEPKTDTILPGQKVVLTARPSKKSEFAGWRYPDGRIVDGEPQLTLDDQCQAGVYKAIFRRRKVNKKSRALEEEEEATGGDTGSAKPMERPENASVAETDVERGVWTSNFIAATNAAEAAHLPVVVVALLPGCPYCVRFHRTIDNEEVKAWQKKLGWYFVMSTSKEPVKFVKSTPIRNKTPPYVGVYWLRQDGRRTMRNFSARAGQMGVPAESSLAQEWMHAIEASVPGAPGASFVSKQGSEVQVYAKIESERLGFGHVKMVPETGLIQPGQKVVLTAKPNNISEFAGWRYPDGRIVDGEPQLTLDDQCQAGVYKAIFRRRKVNKKSRVLEADREGE